MAKTEEKNKNNLTTNVEETKEKEAKAKEEETKAYLLEKVEFEIPLDVNNPDETQKLICVNGKNFIIQLGKKVMVPRYVYLAYKNAQNQQMKAMKRERDILSKQKK